MIGGVPAADAATAVDTATAVDAATAGVRSGPARAVATRSETAPRSEGEIRPPVRNGAAGEGPANVPFSLETQAMGGRLAIHLAGLADAARAEEDAARVCARIRQWAARLSRHETDSELSTLNADGRPEVAVGPTLAAALQAARRAMGESEGLADATLLDARLAAEGLAPGGRPGGPGAAWSIEPYGSRRFLVRREPGTQFDLGGTAKGWLAERALELVAAWPSAVVDADGDLAVRVSPGREWEVAIDDPRADGEMLAILRLPGPAGATAANEAGRARGTGPGARGAGHGRWGVATSGTSVHRWTVAGRTSHHIIDPRTRQPAVTDVVQATVLAADALRAEALAKAAVILGSAAGLALLERTGMRGAVVLTERGEVLALPATLSLLAR